MKFEDELRDIVPSISDTAVSELAANYGSSVDFTGGLKVIAKAVKTNKLPSRQPIIYEPWKSIFVEMLAYVMTGITVSQAYTIAVSRKGDLAPALSEAVSLRATATKPKLQILPTTQDFVKALDDCGYDIRFNLCKQRIEANGELMNDNLLAEINLAMMDKGFLKRAVVYDAILYTATLHSYHPIQDYLNSLEWNGKQNIEKLAGYFRPAKPEIFPALLRKWLIGAVDKIMNGYQNPMLVLDGPQGCGKSRFARWLCPLPEYFREGSINPDDKDCKIGAAETWIWEVAELGSTTRRADREALKNFLTTDEFTARASYERNSRQYKAMASYIGTVNDESGILDDPTGARRFWIAELLGIDWSYAKDLKPEDVWAEAVVCWKAGEDHALDAAESASMAETAEDYKTISATEEAIKKWFVIDPANKNIFTTFTDIRTVLEDPAKGNLKGQELDARRIAAALKSLGLRRDRQYVTNVSFGASNKTRARGYYGIKPL